LNAREQVDEEPPCEDCPGNILAANAEVCRLFDLLTSQIRYAMDGSPIGIDYNAIDFLFRIYRVENRRRTFEKIVLLERTMFAAARENKGK